MPLPIRASSIRTLWDRLSPLPGGTRIFSRLLGVAAPYTGTIDAHVVQLRHGFARVELEDRRAVRNHLKSIHAIALMNLAEVSTGVAMLYGLPPGTRAILTGLEISYHRKARGTLTAECVCEPPATNERKEIVLESIIRNTDGQEVATAHARWLVGPER